MFSQVISTNVGYFKLWLQADFESLFGNIRRMLKAGGLFLLVVPTTDIDVIATWTNLLKKSTFASIAVEVCDKDLTMLIKASK